jgi:hypothetical protein
VKDVAEDYLHNFFVAINTKMMLQQEFKLITNGLVEVEVLVDY